MKPSHERLLAALDRGARITCGSMVESARLYYGGVTRVRQGTLWDMACAGLLTRPIECHEVLASGCITSWLEVFPTFAVDGFEEQWNSWAP